MLLLFFFLFLLFSLTFSLCFCFCRFTCCLFSLSLCLFFSDTCFFFSLCLFLGFFFSQSFCFFLFGYRLNLQLFYFFCSKRVVLSKYIYNHSSLLVCYNACRTLNNLTVLGESCYYILIDSLELFSYLSKFCCCFCHTTSPFLCFVQGIIYVLNCFCKIIIIYGNYRSVCRGTDCVTKF